MEANKVDAPIVGRSAGLALMVTVVLLVIASLFFPSVSLIEPVSQTDFEAALAVILGNANLARVMTLFAILGMLLYAYGFSILFRNLGSDSGLSAALLRFGIGVSIFGWGIFAIGMGMRHLVIHLMQRSVEEVAAAEQLQQVALTTQTSMAAVFLAFLAVSPFASFLVGLGLIARFRGMDIQKLASIGLILMGVAAFVNFLVVQHFPTVDFGFGAGTQ